MVQPSVRRPPARRPARWQAWVGLLLFLAVALVVADRAAAAVAADQLRDRVANELAARQVGYDSLDVAIDGTPFLTQVAESRYESINIDLTGVRLRTGEVQATLPALDIVATGVHAAALAVARGDATVTAELVVGSAVVSYAGLSGLVDLSEYFVRDVAFTERDGAIYATATVSAMGLELPIEAWTEVSLQDGQIQLRLRDIGASDVTVPDAALPILDALVNAVIVATMPPLPFDITLDALVVTPAGLAVTATGRGVTLAST